MIEIAAALAILLIGFIIGHLTGAVLAYRKYGAAIVNCRVSIHSAIRQIEFKNPDRAKVYLEQAIED